MNYESQEHYDFEMNQQAAEESRMMAENSQNEQDQAEEIVRPTFLKDLETLINKHSVENASDTPDFILAEYLGLCLSAYQQTITKRDNWFGVDMWNENKLKNPNNELAQVQQTTSIEEPK